MKWDAEEVIKRYNEKKSERSTYEATWQDVAKYCLPRKADIIEKRTPGQKLDYDVYDCFDKDTEILTDRGWKYFEELDYTYKVLSLNPSTNIADYCDIGEIIVQEYTGKLKQFINNSVNFSVTPNHKLYFRSRETENWQLEKISDIKQKSFALKRDFMWLGKEEESIVIIPQEIISGRESAQVYTFKMDDWLEFLGWFISEGFTYWNKKANSYWVNITQSKEKNTDKCKAIKQLLERMGLPSQQYSEMVFRIGSRAIVEHLDQYIKKGSFNKRVPDYVKNLSPRQISIFLESYRKGDGYILDNGEKRYNTISKLLADDIQELILKTGSYARISTRDNIGRKTYYDNHWIETKHLDYLILEYTPDRKTYDTYIYSDDIKDVDYEGNIYCVTTEPYHLIYVRKDGACFWSGNSTAIQANIVLAAGFHSYMTNPSSKWFTLRTQNAGMMEKKEIKLWLKLAEERMYDTINASNFNQQIHEVYLDMPVFGWGCLYVTEDMRDVVRYYSRSVAEVYIDEDEAERVDTVYRKFSLTARQAYRLWGKESGKTTLELIRDDDDDTKVEFCHFIGPRDDYNPGKRDSGNMPYASMYIDVKNREIISESGYWEFPFMCPRFNKQAGELYGTGPGLVSYSDIKMLNNMDLVTIRAAQKIVDPPMVLPHDGFLLPIKQSPGAINYATRSNPNDRIDFLNSPANIPVSFEMMNARRQVIQRNFFVDLFLLMAQVPEGRMTATEVIQRNAEKMLILAPTLGRLMSELLNPVINRTFNIMLRAGVIPPAPQSLRGQEYVIEYTSPLAKAQKAADLNSMQNFLGMVGQMAGVAPGVLDKIDSDEVIDKEAEMHNVPPSIIRSKEEVAAIRQQRAQQQAQMAQMQQLNAVAQIADTGTKALKNYTEAEEVATNAGQPAAAA